MYRRYRAGSSPGEAKMRDSTACIKMIARGGATLLPIAIPPIGLFKKFVAKSHVVVL